MRGSVESHALTMRVEEVNNPRVELALDSIDLDSLESRQAAKLYQKRDMSKNTALISCLILRASTTVGIVAACPR